MKRNGSLSNNAGYTILLVLVLISLTGILVTISIKEQRFVKRTATDEIQRVHAHLLAESGITRAEYFLGGGEGHTTLWESEGCDEEVHPMGSIHLECTRFGLFSKVVSQGTRNNTVNTITAIVGRTLPDFCKPVLTLSGKMGGVALMPTSRIKGTVVLTRGRVCRGESLEEVKDKDLHVMLRETSALPIDSAQAIGSIKVLENEFKKACTLKTDITGDVLLSSEMDSLFSNGSLIVNGNCRIENGTYVEKSIFSTGSIILSGTAKCIACKCSAKRIIVDGGIADKSVFFSSEMMNISGGSFNSQAFCTDSILITDKTKFGQMSIIMLMREGVSDSTSTIRFGPGTNFHGSVVCCADSLARIHSLMPSIVFSKGCVINGLCMTDGDVFMSDVTVRGHLWARSIVSTDGKKAYVNYCFNITIEEPKNSVIFPLVGGPPLSLVTETIAEQYAVKKTTVLPQATLQK